MQQINAVDGQLGTSGRYPATVQQQTVKEGQNVIQQAEPQIVEEAPVNTDAGLPGPQPP